MSSKKEPSKKAPVKKPVTKPAVKKSAPKAAAKPAPKASAKVASAKSVAATKPASKSSAKTVAKQVEKPAQKLTQKPSAKSAVKKSAPKATAKPAPKASAKVASAKVASAKSAAATKPASKSSAKPVAKQVEKPAQKPSAKPAVKKSASKATAKSAPKVSNKTAVPPIAKNPKKVKSGLKEDLTKVEPIVTVDTKNPPKESAPAHTKSKVESKKKDDIPYAVLLDDGKGRMISVKKSIFFIEIDENEERANKKKVSANNDEKSLPTASIRNKTSLAEETQEELTERILKELEEQNLAFTREASMQICTRCNKNVVSPEFWVDKHLGYCEECAAILKLGQSKEARKVEYQMGAMGGDSLDEADDSEFGDGPDVSDLKNAVDDLVDFDD